MTLYFKSRTSEIHTLHRCLIDVRSDLIFFLRFFSLRFLRQMLVVQEDRGRE